MVSCCVCLIVLPIIGIVSCQETEGGVEREGPPIVKTDEGEVEGFPSVYPAKPNVTVNVFLGIPYARPPIGVYRFLPPVVLDPWTGLFRATVIPPACPQKPFPFYRFVPAIRKWSLIQPISEDCLTLNVWSPRVVFHPPRIVLLDVVVFIHGGGFMKGTATLPHYDGLAIAALHNVVFVSFNYRLSSFGYLYLDHPGAPGNAGMHDQIMALQWVQRNIMNFGGDPAKVTVIGHSAGACSISYHMLSPLSNGLFNRAVLFSGGPTSDWSYGEKEPSIKLSEKLIENSGCARGSSKDNLTEAIQCLQALPVDDILGNEPGFGYDDIFVFKPVVDEKFLTANPRALLQQSNLTKTDIMFSSVLQEASIFLPGQLPSFFSVNGGKPFMTREAFSGSLKSLLQLEDGLPLRLIQHEYSIWNDLDDGSANARSVMDLFSDYYFNCAETEMADAFEAAGSTVYRTLFAHRSSVSTWPSWMGVAHGDDILYLIGEPMRPGLGYSAEEAQLSERYMGQVLAFAKTGNPNSALSDFILEPYTVRDRALSKFELSQTTTEKAYRDRQCQLWNEILPELLASLKPNL